MDKLAAPGSLKPWAIAYAVYSLFMAAALSPVLLRHVGPVWDANDFFYPALAYLSDSIREGRFPLWDPYTSCGYPYHADPNNPTLNPLAILVGYLFRDTTTAFAVFWSVMWWWAGTGMMRLAGHFGASPSGALVAAASYVFSGFFLGHAEHMTFIIVASWLPWIFFFADRAVARSDIACALLAGASMGLCSYGGYPVLVFFTGFALCLWLALRFLAQAGPDGSDARPLRVRALWVGGTLMLAACALLLAWSPVLHAFFVEGGGYTERAAALTPHQANSDMVFSLPICISIFFPYVTIIAPGWLGSDFSMNNGYVGMLAAPFAALWWLKGGGRRPWWFLSLVVFMFLLTFGEKAYIRTLLYYVLPPMRFMRFSAPFRLYWMLPVCLAAGAGFSLAERRPQLRGLLLKILAAWALLSVLAAAASRSSLSSMGLMGPGPVVTRTYLGGLVVVALGLLVTWRWSRGGQGTFPRVAAALAAALVLMDMGAHLYNNSFTVWRDRPEQATWEQGHARNTTDYGAPEPRIPYRIAGYMNVQQILKRPVVEGYTAMKSPGFNEVLVNSRFAEVLASPQRFWVSPGVVRTPSRDRALYVLSGTGAGDEVPAFVAGYTGSLPEAAAVPGSFGEARVSYYSPEKVELEADVPGEKGGFLASTERYAAGWKVWVDGVRREPVVTNVYFRGVELPPGRHAVLWKYEPDHWGWLVLLSYSTIAASLAAAAFLLVRRKAR